MKLCKDCKWCSEEDNWYYCNHPKNLKKITSLVTGKTKTTQTIAFCSTQRSGSSWWCGTCGKQGRWFEPKEG